MESKASNAEYKSFIDAVKKLPSPPNLPSLYDAFWLMRISPYKLKQMKENHPESTVFQELDNLKTNICLQYEQQFQEQFENSIVYIIDSIYKNRFALRRQLKKVCICVGVDFKNSDEEKGAYGPNMTTKLCANCKDIVKQIHNAFIFIPKLSKFFAQLEEETCYSLDKKPSNLYEFDKIINSQRGISKDLFEKIQNRQIQNRKIQNPWECIRRKEVAAKKLLPQIKEELSELLRGSKPSDFADLKKICEKECGNESELVILITRLQYLEFTAFNQEKIFTLLFLHDDCIANISEYSMSSFVVDRTEKFFLDLYDYLQQELKGKSNLMQVLFGNAVPKDIADSYVPLPDYDIKAGLSFFDLKKLTSLFLTYTVVTHSKNHLIYDYAVHFDRTLSVTKLTHIAYNPFLDDPMTFIKKHYGLQQKEVAKILDITPETLSKHRKAGKLYSNHAWFWQLLTGCTDTYLRGETTIPKYGKNDEKSITFKHAVLMLMPYPDIFLDRVRAIKDFLLEKRKKAKKKYMLSEKMLQSVMKEVLKFGEEIRNYRIYIDKLYEKEHMCTIMKDTKGVKQFKKKANDALSFFSSMIEHCITVSSAYHMLNDSGEDITALKKSLNENRKQLNEIVSQYKSIISNRE